MYISFFRLQVLKVWAKNLWPAGLPEGIVVDRLVEAFFPSRTGWTPGRQVKTDGVRVSLTYVKMEPSSSNVTVRDTKKADTKRRAKAKRDTGVSATAYASFDPTIPEDQLIDLATVKKGTIFPLL